jgi:hypothetical protein
VHGVFTAAGNADERLLRQLLIEHAVTVRWLEGVRRATGRRTRS